MAPPVIRDEDRRTFMRAVRKAIVDITQSANYFDRYEYDRAFANGEEACESCLVALRALKSSMGRKTR